ncbi:MAG TPA: hypothetical protein PLV13_02930 [Ilumatobacteraceae bacterium]|nr:hypothetical protein [Ilumatobacteraceae bacterium]
MARTVVVGASVVAVATDEAVTAAGSLRAESSDSFFLPPVAPAITSTTTMMAHPQTGSFQNRRRNHGVAVAAGAWGGCGTEGIGGGKAEG